MASDIIESQRRFTAELLGQERTAAAQMADAYSTVYRSIQVRFTALTDQIGAAQAAGEPVKVSWLYEEQRLSVFRATVEDQMARFSNLAQDGVTASQQRAVELAKQHAKEAILAAVDDPERAKQLADHIDYVATQPDIIANLVGTLGNGAPLSNLFDELGPDASKSARSILTAGVANGTNPRVMARQLRDAMGGNLVRALTVARTETMRSYRSANQNIYRANNDVIDGWIWVADLSPDSCAACIALNGTVHPLDEEFGSHPNCRCAPSPRARGSRVAVTSGATWFGQQDADTQRAILGPAGYKLYQQGTPISAFVKTTESQTWGMSRTVKSVAEIAATQ